MHAQCPAQHTIIHLLYSTVAFNMHQSICKALYFSASLLFVEAQLVHLFTKTVANRDMLCQCLIRESVIVTFALMVGYVVIH